MRRVRIGLAAGGLALGLGAESVSYQSGQIPSLVGDLVVGCVLIGCGLIAWERRGQSWFGPLMTAAGGTWFLGSFGTAALYLHRGPLVHALLSYPGCRVSHRLGRVVVVAAYVEGVIEPVGATAAVALMVGAAVVAAAAQGYVGEVGPRRRARAPALAGAAALGGLLALGAVGRLEGWGTDAATLWAYEVALVLVAAGLLCDVVFGRGSQRAVTGLLVDLGRAGDSVTLRDRLARALGDNSLELGYWLDAERGFVDDAGREFVPPKPGSGRTVTPIGRADAPTAVLVHDGAVLDDAVLLDAVSAATRIALTNVRLQAQVRARVEQLAASRRRIVEAADAQRRHLERELKEGAARRLAAVAEHLERVDVEEGPAAELLADARRELGHVRAEVGELARGIHPAALTSGGLSAALRELAARASLPVEVQVDATRYHPAVEAALYFVCSEALTNVEKYAHASRVEIEVKHRAGAVVVAIADDGVGGADPRSGTGLRGLADRVEALGGGLTVQSPPGHGTRLVAEIPAE